MHNTATAAALDSYLTLDEIKDLTKVSTSTIYRWMDDGTFPKPIKMSRNCVRWRGEDVRAWQSGLVQAAA